jgi:hypothetical protein
MTRAGLLVFNQDLRGSLAVPAPSVQPYRCLSGRFIVQSRQMASGERIKGPCAPMELFEG